MKLIYIAALVALIAGCNASSPDHNETTASETKLEIDAQAQEPIVPDDATAMLCENADDLNSRFSNRKECYILVCEKAKDPEACSMAEEYATAQKPEEPDASSTHLTGSDCIDNFGDANGAFDTLQQCYAYVCTRTHDEKACAARGDAPLNANQEVPDWRVAACAERPGSVACTGPVGE